MERFFFYYSCETVPKNKDISERIKSFSALN